MISRRQPRRAVATFIALLCLLATAHDGIAATFSYARAFGGFATDKGAAVAVDGSGNVYLTGHFTGVVDFNPGAGVINLTGGGLTDVYVVKLDSGGNHVWARRLGGALDDQGLHVAVDGSGNVYVTGLFGDVADLDPGAGTLNFTSAGGSDVFVVKLSSSGALVWARAIGGSGDDEGSGLAVDTTGNVYLTGKFEGTVDFDPGASTLNLTSAGADDAFFLKLDSAGNLTWARRIGGTGEDGSRKLVVDTTGNVYAAGRFSNTVDVDPGAGTLNLTSNGVTDLFALKLDAGGNLIWAKSVGGPAIDHPNAMALDASGNVYLTGAFGNTVDFDPGPGTFNLVCLGFTDVFALKLSPGGDFVWARGFGSVSGSEGGHGVAVDAAGNVYLAGYFLSTVDFDPGAGVLNLTSAGSEDVFASKLDAGGNLVWVRSVGASGNDQAAGMAMDSFGSVFVTGEFANSVDFDPGSGTSNIAAVGGADAFLLKLVQAAPPVNTFRPSMGTLEDTPLVFSSANGTLISISDSDAGSSPLRISLLTSSGTLTLSTTAGLSFVVGDGTADGLLIFTSTLSAVNAALDGMVFAPNSNLNGPVGIAMTTADQVGPTGGQIDADLITITIGEVNDAPTATSDAYDMGAGQTLNVSAANGVLKNDTDVEGTALTAALVTGPAHGTLSLSPSGDFTYTPQASFVGADTFTYRASDGSATSSPVTVTITVAGSACAPRPRVVSNPVANGTQLQVRVQATPLGTGASNALQRVTFTRLDNARVTLNGQNISAGQAHTPPANAAFVDFTVARVTAGQPTTVHITVVDGCGEWQTFVGGGTGAGF